ncbi:MAG: hypothetical protein Q8L64_04200 [bacterium]|nr:hypothetical protein [bacterium]
MAKYASWILSVGAVVLIVFGMIWYASKPGQYDTFASCIADSGAKFYGAFWCQHCQDQKAIFGKSASKLPYIECAQPSGNGQLQVCIDADIQSYPTWDTPEGDRLKGVLSMAQLASMTQCVLEKDSDKR